MQGEPPRLGRVLIVDDDDAGRYLVGRAFAGAGYEVVAVASGAEALAAAARERPDLIVLDVNLPDVLGYEVARQLKSERSTAGVPIVQLSAAFVSAEDRARGFDGGADAYLVAPVANVELLAAARALIGAARTRREQSALELREALLSAGDSLVHHLGEALVVTDGRGVVRTWNPGAETLFGWSAAEMIGSSITRLSPSPPPDLPAHLRAVAAAADGGDVTRELLLRRKDGSDVWVHTTRTVIKDDAGNVVAFVGLSKDISVDRRRRLELETHLAGERQLLGIVSHDLREPMNTMMLALLTLEEHADVNTKRAVRALGTALRRTTQLVDGLLDLTRIRSGGGLTLERSDVDLRDVVGPIVDDFAYVHKDRAIAWRANGDVSGRFDGRRLSQVVQNLIGNALQHGSRDVAVDVVVAGDDDAVTLTVQNGGAAIPPALLPTIFQPFRRGRAHGGDKSLGLGLFIVKEIARAHGGDVEVHSDDVQTAFVVRLPRAA